MTSIIEQVQQPKSTQSKTQVDKEAMNIPASWYIAMHSKDLSKKPMAIELFGQSLVAWRDQNNHPVIMEPYCSHKGANLAIGEVVDGCIQCPFHHWRYDSSGKCVFIPEVEHIPPRARQATYVTIEKYGCIWVWYGSQTPLFPVPEFPEAEDEKHSYIPMRAVIKVNTPLQEAIENSVDFSHFTTLHKMKFSGPIKITELSEQQVAEQGEAPLQKEAWIRLLQEFPLSRRGGIVGGLSRALGLSAVLSTLQVDIWPNGFIITNFTDGKVIYKDLSCATPVTENKVNLMILRLYKKTGKFWLDRLYAALLHWRILSIIAEDIPIWNSIKPSAAGVYVKNDWLMLKFKKFYQSWVDKVE